jgi:hypothetical protein
LRHLSLAEDSQTLRAIRHLRALAKGKTRRALVVQALIEQNEPI